MNQDRQVKAQQLTPFPDQAGRFYRVKFKPETIQYLEQHLPHFYKFMEEMTVATAHYFEQTVPIKMNNRQEVTTTATDRHFIAPGSTDGQPVGLVDAEKENIQKASLLLIGRAVNTYDGENYLDLSVSSHNQWFVYIDNKPAFLQNAGKGDGQMADEDWRCLSKGVIHPFTFMWDITSALGLSTKRPSSISITPTLVSARAKQNSFVVTVDVFLKVLWKL